MDIIQTPISLEDPSKFTIADIVKEEILNYDILVKTEGDSNNNNYEEIINYETSTTSGNFENSLNYDKMDTKSEQSIQEELILISVEESKGSDVIIVKKTSPSTAAKNKKSEKKNKTLQIL